MGLWPGDVPDSGREGWARGSAGLFVLLASLSPWSWGSSLDAGPAVVQRWAESARRQWVSASSGCWKQSLGVGGWRGLSAGAHLRPERVFADPLGPRCPMSIRAQS